MSYDLESNQKTLGNGPDVAVMKNETNDVAAGASGEGGDVTYPTVSVVIPTYTKARWTGCASA